VENWRQYWGIDGNASALGHHWGVGGCASAGHLQVAVGVGHWWGSAVGAYAVVHWWVDGIVMALVPVRWCWRGGGVTINMRWKGGQGKGERDKGGMCGGGCEGGVA
jgi:hypothetical protein